MQTMTRTARPYPSAEALAAVAVALCREHPDCQERILRGLDLARTGCVADLAAAPSDAPVLTQVNGHLVVYTPNAPWVHGLTCTCPDAHYGAGLRHESAAAYDEYKRMCKHQFALVLVGDARELEARPVALRHPQRVVLLDVDPQTLRLVA